MQSYLIMMAVRLLEMKRLLKPTGSIYLHCDPTASHYLKLVMDTMFGATQFQNEITWQRTTAHNDSARYGRNSDTLLFYSNRDRWTWNVQYEPHGDAYKARFRNKDSDGRLWSDDNLTAKGLSGGGYEYEYKGASSLWRVPLKRMQELDSEGRLHFTKRGGIRLKRYLDDTKGRPLQAVWTSINVINSQAKERLNYPTQKPLALLERIIAASSNEGDVVLDPFCGCATALVAAEKMGRDWVGIDLSAKAKDLIKIRMGNELGLFGLQTVYRDDVPRRTDLGKLPPPQTHKNTLFGRQEGYCAGCRGFFHIVNLTIDHIVPQNDGGTHHLDNLQLLCGHCNSVKGTKTQEEFLARLKRDGIGR